jgi:hypothetical protein
MKQMLAPQAPVLQEVRFYELGSSFIRKKTGNGEVFYVWNRAGGPFPLPVWEDGTIAREVSLRSFSYHEVVCVINPLDLGIKSIKLKERNDLNKASEKEEGQ